MRRTEVLVGLLLATAVAVTGCQGGGSIHDKDTIVIGVGGVQAVSPWAQHLAARGSGAFAEIEKEFDVKIEFQDIDAATSISALTSGNIDFLISSVPNFAAARADGVDVSSVALLGTGLNSALVARKDLEASKGMDLSAFDDSVWGYTSPGSAMNVVAQTAAESAGLRWDDLKTVAFGKVSAAIPALESGRLDVATMDVGSAGVAVHDGVGYVLYNANTDAEVDVMGQILQATGKTVKEDPALVQAIVDAYLGGIEAVMQNADDADAVLGLFPEEYQELLTKGFDEQWELTAPGQGGDGLMSAEIVDRTIGFLVDADYLEASDTVADMVRGGFNNDFAEVSNAK